MIHFLEIKVETRTVIGVGNVKLDVHGKGDIEIISIVNGEKRNGIIKNVLFVPDLGTNILSIGTATKSRIEVHFIDNSVYFTLEERVEMEGRRVGNTLYHLNIEAQEIKGGTTLQVKNHTSLSVWHERFAHINTITIQKMSSQKVVGGLEFSDIAEPSALCVGCIFGKMYRSPFTHWTQKGN